MLSPYLRINTKLVIDTILVKQGILKGYTDLVVTFALQTQSTHKECQGEEWGSGGNRSDSKYPGMEKFMNVGSNKWISRFSEILNSVMEKIHRAKVEHIRLLLFRDSWYLGSFPFSPESNFISQPGNSITAFTCLLT